MNTSIQTYLRDSAFNYLGYIPRIRIVIPHGNSIYNFFEKPSYYFPQQLYYFHFYQQATSIPISPYPHQHIIFCFVCLLLTVTIPMSMKWNVILVSNCIYLWLVMLNIFYVFICLCTTSLDQYLFKSFGYSWIKLFVFLLLSFRSSL